MTDDTRDDHLETTDHGAARGMSRRAVLGGAAIAVGAGAGLLSTAAYAKTAQKDAQYQTMPKGSAMCSSCMQFEAPNACKLVEGDISPNGWCILYTPKAS